MRLEGQKPNVLDVDDDELLGSVSSVASGGANGIASLSSHSGNVKNNQNSKISNGHVPLQHSLSSSGQHLHHGPVKMPIKITNIISNHQLSDTLHQRAKPIACANHACLGALMAGMSNDGSITRTKEEIMEHAVDFLEQFFIHKKASQEDLSSRLADVATELELTGTYTPTIEELHFGAKTAWRNASRCIGRIQWNKLEIQDARHVTTSKEMFEAICQHLEYATNGGNLRSMITVFPQRIPGRDDFRLWNAQLIHFAGYLQADGSVIGDPRWVQFTRVCQRLGWKGKGGRFDVLPIIVSAPGEGPKFYDVPDHLALRVKLEHPRFEWFKDMNLQWYALPAVSDMLFDCGGLQFTAAPFNGWYMGTEIGARDLCDPQRLNITEDVALKMGLDIANPSNLWKDQVLVEVNIAVLYSYQKNGVTIVDHHTASESFIKHMQTEQRQRGGCPADWVWIVPPMSGSITPVFHQEMINYNLKPSYEYQDRAWKLHKWNTSNITLKYKFVSVARAALWSSALMSLVMSKRVKSTILYATETGKSETFANKLGKLMQKSFFAQIKCMDDYKFEDLINESILIVVTSTFGNGEAPDNGKEFWKHLYRLTHSETPIKLTNLKYAVFALGSTQYPTFCAFGKNIDKALTELGANSMLPIGLGDELRGQEQAFGVWAQECYKTSCETFKLDVEKVEISIDIGVGTYIPEKVRIKEVNVDTSDEHYFHHELTRLHKKKILPCKVISRVRLQPENSERQTILVRMSPSNLIARNMFDYEPGDHLGVFPSNPKEIVDALLGHVHRAGYEEPDIVIQVETMVDGKWTPDSRLPSCTLRDALTKYLDITTPPNQNFLEYLIDMANDNWDSFRLKKLASDADNYEKWRLYNCPNMADVLNEFPSVHVDPEFLLTQLPLLQPRYYSISSTRKVTPEEVHLTLGVVTYKTHDGTGPVKYGVCSNYFDGFPQTDVPCFFRAAPGFRLPEDSRAPIIMIGAGSGIAPFRSFWQERDVQIQNGEKCGKMFLFFGCRTHSDNIFESEISVLLRKGIIHEVFLALSRDSQRKKRYVQHELLKQRALVNWLIHEEKAHIYVCGDVLMADGVKKSLIKIIENDGRVSEKKALEAIEELHNQNRYHEDVFGAIHFKS